MSGTRKARVRSRPDRAQLPGIAGVLPASGPKAHPCVQAGGTPAHAVSTGSGCLVMWMSQSSGSGSPVPLGDAAAPTRRSGNGGLRRGGGAGRRWISVRRLREAKPRWTFCLQFRMVRTSNTSLRRGWTIGACATAATKAALTRALPIACWVECIARRGDEIRDRMLARLVGCGILESDEPGPVFLSPEVSRSRRYPAAKGAATEEVQVRIMNSTYRSSLAFERSCQQAASNPGDEPSTKLGQLQRSGR